MSEFNDLKSKPKAKRRLKGVHFQFSGAEVSYTSSDIPAASGDSEAYLIKSVKESKPLTEKQKEILELIGEEPTPLEKSVGEQQPPSSDDGSGDISKSEDEENVMNEAEEKALRKELADVQKELATAKKMDVVKSLSLEEPDMVELAGALASVGEEASTKIEKAFETLQAKLGESLKKSSEENPLAKSLQEEQGHEEIQKNGEALSFKDRVRAEANKHKAAKGAK